MQMDGEPWRQPIPAAADARLRRRPTGLQQSGASATGAAGGGAPQQGQQPQAASDQQQQQQQQQGGSGSGLVTLHVSHAGRSCMLFNVKDPQGGRRVRRIAERGATESRKLPSQYSFLGARVAAGSGAVAPADGAGSGSGNGAPADA